MTRSTTRSFPYRLGLALGLLVPGSLASQSWNVDSARAPSKLLEFTATEGTWLGLDVSPDGRTIVFDLLGHLYEIPITGGAATPLTTGRSYNHMPRYSPDGSRILFSSDRGGNEELWLLHRGTDSLEQLTHFGYRAMSGTWAPDGRHIYLTTADLGYRFQGYRIDLFGSKTQITNDIFGGAPSHFTEHPTSGKVYYGEPARAFGQGGLLIQRYDLRTGEREVYLQRVGGAGDPVLSPDGRYLAYIHRDDLETQLILHELATQTERVLLRHLDRDRMESGPGVTYGIYPNFSWHPSGREIIYAQGGKIHAVSVVDAATREIPFQAPVRRELAETIRFPLTIPDVKARTRSHRWAQRTDQGILHVALGDLYLTSGNRITNLTKSEALESSPVYDPATKTVFYVAWTDDSLGSLWSLSLATPRRPPTRLAGRPAQYGALTLSADGRTLAYLRGSDDLNRGGALDHQKEFTLVLQSPDRAEREVGPVHWAEDPNNTNHLAPGMRFAPDGRSIYFDEVVHDTLFLEQVRLDGTDRRSLIAFPHAATALPSPDLKWVAFREYQRTYLVPLSFAGKPTVVTAIDRQGATFRVDLEDGEDVRWTADSKGLTWVRGAAFREKAVADVIAGRKTAAASTDLSFEFDVTRPSGTVALVNARVITMDRDRRVIPNATILVRGNRIEAVGAGIPVPAGAKVFDLTGKTVMPGIIDAHGHYNSQNSVLGVMEQDQLGLVANLAYGTTTLYEVYGNHLKDPAVSDLERAGLTAGSRLLSVLAPIYGFRSYRTRQYRPIFSQADADEVVGFNRAFGATALKDYLQFNRSARQQEYDAARRMGVNVVAESGIEFQMDWTMLIDGISGIEHTPGLTPLYSDVVKLWRATETGLTPTLVVSYNGPPGEALFRQTERVWDDPKLQRFFPREYLLGFRRPTHYFADDAYVVELAAEIHKLAAAGVSVQVSGHGQMHGLDKHWELELMARGGFTPAEALATATINSARYLGIDRQLGSIEAGKLADLVILDADPLDDIRNTRKIDRVMKSGVLYRGDDVSRLYPDPEGVPRTFRFRGSPRGVVGDHGG